MARSRKWPIGLEQLLLLCVPKRDSIGIFVEKLYCAHFAWPMSVGIREPNASETIHFYSFLLLNIWRIWGEERYKPHLQLSPVPG